MSPHFTRRFDENIARQLRAVADNIEHDGVAFSAYLDPTMTSDKPFRLKATQEKFTHDAKTALSWHLRELWHEDPNQQSSDSLLRSRRALAQVLHKHPQLSGFAMEYVLALEEAVSTRIAEIKAEPNLPPVRHSQGASSHRHWSR